MERRYHSTSHLGRLNIDRYMLPQIGRMTVTIGDLDNLAKLQYVKLQIAIFRRNEVAIRTHECNLEALADYANDMKAAGVA